MRLLQIVILTLITVYPDDVLTSKGLKRRSKAPDKNGPCGKIYLRQINGKCYYFPVKKMNWFGAQNNCLRKSLNLADLATEEDFNGVMNFIRSRGNMDDYWFGGNDLQTEGRFTYISTGRPVRYFGGADGIEPTLRSNLDDCLEVRVRKNSTIVTDDNCLEKQYFVCQQSQGKCAQPTPDENINEHHSHEHLHHFHHDTAKDGKTGQNGKPETYPENDSRNNDNSNSTEIGDSGGNNSEMEAGEDSPGESPSGEASPAAEEKPASKSPKPKLEDKETTPALDQTEKPKPNEEGAESPAPTEEGAPATEGAETPAPAAEGAETPAPAAEGAETPAPAAEGAETPAPAAEGAETPAPAAEGAETPAPAAEGAETPAPAEEGAENPIPPDEGPGIPPAAEGAEADAPDEAAGKAPAQAKAGAAPTAADEGNAGANIRELGKRAPPSESFKSARTIQTNLVSVTTKTWQPSR